jgi:hypothetical protein
MRIVCLSPPFPNTSITPLKLYSDPNERAYFWLPSSEATSTHELLDSPEAERLYIDQGEIVRVRVERDEFCDDEPGPPKATEGVLISGQGQARRLPYTVTVSPQDFFNCINAKQYLTPPLSALSLSRASGQQHGGRPRRPGWTKDNPLGSPQRKML